MDNNEYYKQLYAKKFNECSHEMDKFLERYTLLKLTAEEMHLSISIKESEFII